MDGQNKTLTARVYLERLETLVEVHCVLTRECEPLGFIELGESEPFKEFFFTNPTEQSQKTLKLWQNVPCDAVLGEKKVKCTQTLSPLPLSGAKAFICQGTGNKLNQPKNIGENTLQVEGGKGEWGCTRCEREKNMHELRGIAGRWAGELSGPLSQSPWTQCLST